MANLIMPDTFEPYYAGREDEAERRTTSRRQTKKLKERRADGEIVLPEEAPVPEGVTRRDRRPVSH
jgi:hypothetical protein